MAALSGVARTVILGRALRAEQVSGQRNMNRVLIALDEDFSAMDRFNLDRSAWDATYEFMAHPSNQFLFYLFGDNARGTPGTRRLTSLILLNGVGEIVAERGFVRTSGEPLKIPGGLRPHLVPTDELLPHPKLHEGLKALVMVPEGALLAVSRPILSSIG